MSDLISKIRSAQIRAGEGAICDRLRELGLIAEKVADVQRPLNALKIAAALHDGACPSYVRLDAAEMLRQQHAEIERLKADAERVNSCAKNLAIAMHRRHFSHITQWEPLPDTIGLITQIDNMSCWPDSEIERLTAERETIISDFLKRTGQYVTNDASRDAAIAAAVLAERTAITTQLRNWAAELGFGGSWRWKTPGGLLYQAAEMVSDRTNPRASVDSGHGAAIVADVADVAAESEACARICETSISREEAVYLIRNRAKP